MHGIIQKVSKTTPRCMVYDVEVGQATYRGDLGIWFWSQIWCQIRPLKTINVLCFKLAMCKKASSFPVVSVVTYQPPLHHVGTSSCYYPTASWSTTGNRQAVAAGALQYHRSLKVNTAQPVINTSDINLLYNNGNKRCPQNVFLKKSGIDIQ